MTNTELIKNVEQWFVDRGLDKADPWKQMLKLIEEVGELSSAMARGNKEDMIDAVGDIQVVLIGYMMQHGIPHQDFEVEISGAGTEYGYLNMLVGEVAHLGKYSSNLSKIISRKGILKALYKLSGKLDINPEEALASAYDVIKDRKGKLVNGVFIKEEDLK